MKSTPKLRPLHITDRDRELLQALAAYRVLTTNQIRHLHFPSLHRTRKRLVQLWRHGMLVRAVKAVRLGEGSSQFYYGLSRKGREFLPATTGNQSLLHRNVRAFSRHSEQTNDFRICLTLAARMTDDLTISSWTQGRALRMIAAPLYSAAAKPMTIIPDAMFTILCSGRSYSYFLEIDRGTTDLGRIAMKCAGYHWLWQRKIPHQKLSIRSFRVLFVTTTPKRRDHVIQKLFKLQHYSVCPDLITVSDASLVSLERPERLFAADWRTVSERGAEIAASPFPAPSFIRSRQRQEHHPCAGQNPDASCKEPPGPVDEGAPRLPGSGSGFATDERCVKF